MDWRRTLPLVLLLLNGWIAIGFLPATFGGPASLVLFAGLTAVGIMAGIAVRKEPQETEQNVLGVGLVVILCAAIAMAAVGRFGPPGTDVGAPLQLVFSLWAFASGYTVGRYWSVPQMSRPLGTEKGSAAAPEADPAATGIEKDRPT